MKGKDESKASNDQKQQNATSDVNGQPSSSHTTNANPTMKTTARNAESIHEKEAKPEEMKTGTEEIKQGGDSQKSNTESTQPPPSFREKLQKSNPTIYKVVDYCVDCWEETFPNDKYKRRFADRRKQAEAVAKAEELKEQLTKDLTEEDLAKLQADIPEWKRTSMILKEDREDKKKAGNRIKEKLKEKFNQTTLAQKIYASDEYKNYADVKKDLAQFKADVKDHLHQSQNPIVIGSMSLLEKITSESNTAKAISEMKQIDPDFDVWELEEEAKAIFLFAYNACLMSDLESLEKVCAESALAYFKNLINTRKTQGVTPKYEELWDIEDAMLLGGHIPDKKLPTFTFTIKTQEIHCNYSIKEKKIVDGAEDRIMYNQYNFALTLHSTPDIITTGHKWEVIELAQVGSLAALV